MSYDLIKCTECDKSGIFDIQLSFEYQQKVCDKCHHVDNYFWQYYFCKTDCMFNWLRKNNIETEGFPCQSCRETGYAFGFQQNGICKTCNGTKKVKKLALVGHKCRSIGPIY